jgi:hypothetical protein
MTINAYDQGDLVRSSATFATAAGVATDPAVVKCQYKNPAGVTVTLTYLTDVALVRDSMGNYHVDIDAATKGAWYVRWYATGTGQSAGERQFLVLTSAF